MEEQSKVADVTISKQSTSVKRRMVITSIDSVLEMFKDYLGEDNLPKDAKVGLFRYKPNEQGRFMIVAGSDSIKQGAAPLNVHFDVKRIYGVS